MKLKFLSGTNIKGRTFTHEFGGVNVFTGLNKTGKTARTDAIALLCCPESRGRKITKLFKGSRAEVKGTFDNGVSWTNTWTQSLKKGKASWSTDAKVPFETPLQILDISHFTRMTEEDRIKYVFSLADLASLGFSEKEIRATIKNVRVEKNTEHTEEVLEDILETADNEFECQNLQTAMTAIMDYANKKWSEAAATIKRLTGAKQSSIQLEAGQEDKPIRPDIEKVIAERRQHLAQAKEDQADYYRKKALAENRDARRREISVRIKAGDELREKDRKLKESLAGLPILTTPARPKEEDSEIRTAFETAHDRKCELQRQRNDAHVRIEMLKKALRDTADEECPKCHHHWPSTMKQGHQAELERLIKVKAQIDDELPKATELAESTHKVRVANMDAVREDRKRYRAEIEAFEANSSDRSSFQKRIAAIAPQIEELKTLEMELSLYPTIELPDPAGVPTTEDINRIAEEVLELEQDWKRLVARRAAAMAEANAEQLLEKAKAEKEVAGAVGDAMRDKMRELNAKVFGRVLLIAHRFTHGFLPGQLDFIDGEFGYYDGAQWVSFDVFSGLEKAIAGIGLQIALCQSAPYKLVIWDELGTVAESARKEVIDRMEKLVADGIIDQFFGIDVANIYKWTAATVIEIK